MNWRVALVLIVLPTMLALDLVLIHRVLAAWRVARRRAHLFIVAGIAASFLVGVAGGGIVLFDGDPSATTPLVWHALRSSLALSTAGCIGAVALFSASAFHPESTPTSLAALGFVALMVTLALAGLALEPVDVPSPATWAYALRAPFVLLSVAPFAWVAVECRAMLAPLEEARALGRAPNLVAMKRMQLLGRGSLCAAGGQLFLMVPAVHARAEQTLVGWIALTVVLSSALAFVLSVALTWATPTWLRERWRRP